MSVKLREEGGREREERREEGREERREEGREKGEWEEGKPSE